MRPMSKHTPPQDFKGLDDYIEIFRSGTHTSANGITRTWTDDELDQMVANHSAATAVPIVVGHPAHNAPAFGWSAELCRDGNKLLAKFRDINPEFKASVDRGEFRKRSSRIYKTDAGTWAVDHVGFLGAQRPAIPLDALNYSGHASAETYDFVADWTSPSLWRRLRELLIVKFGIEDADRAVPDYAIQNLEAQARNEEAEDAAEGGALPNLGTAYTAPQGGSMPFTQADIDAAKKAARDEAATEFSAKEQTLKELLDIERRKGQSTEFAAAITAAIDAGRLTPAQAEGMCEFMLDLESADTAQFEFSAGNAKVKKTPLVWFQEFMAKLPKQVSMGAEREQGFESGSADFTAPGGYAVSVARLDTHNKALDYQRAHPGTDYLVAVAAVNK